MLSKILDKSAKIAVIDNSAATRQLLSETVKAFGFSEIRGLASIKDLIEFLETESIDLILCGLEKQQNEYNALSLMHMITQHEELRHMRLCIIADEEDGTYLPKAFELGCLTSINKPFTKDSLKAEFGAFVNAAQEYGAKEALVASDSIRAILRKNKQFEELVGFERKLLSLYPGVPTILVYLAEALMAMQKYPEAKSIIAQTLLIEPSLKNKVQPIKDELDKKAPAQGEDPGANNLLGLSSAVIVDSDDSIQHGVKDALTSIGIEKIECFTDGVSAAEYLRDNKDVQLVVQEWRVPKLSGPMLVQRIMQEGNGETVIVVLSSLVTAKDMPLLREMGIACIVEKPLEKTNFLKQIIWTVQQERCPTEHNALESKIRKLLRRKKMSDAEQLIARFIGDSRVPESKKLLIQAEWDYVHKRYDGAKQKCISALKSSGDSVLALNLLGRCLIALRDFPSALKLLERAQSLSPQNLERICQIAESHSELGQVTEAKEAIAQAEDLDPDATLVSETKAKVAINTDDVAEAKKIMESLESLDQLVAQMNNRAVALAKVDQFDESLKQYEKTVASLPESKGNLRSLVLYNMSLALTRAGNLDAAKEKLSLALENPSGKIKQRATSLKSRMELAIEKGSPLKLVDATDAPQASQDAAEGEKEEFVVEALIPTPGDIGCYMIFSEKQTPAPAKELLKKKISYTSRAGISRAETMKVKSA